MSYSLNSFKGGYIGDSLTGVSKGDTRSLDYGSHEHLKLLDRLMQEKQHACGTVVVKQRMASMVF